MSYKTTKICALFFISILALPFLHSCKSPTTDLVGNWVALSDFDGVARANAVGFAIGSKGYIGTGYDGEERLKDFWEYDVARNTWTQKASLPDSASIRSLAVGFATDTKGYIGLGFDGVNKLDDFYEYDPTTNTWTKFLNPFPGGARYSAVAMAINNKGYVGTGYDGNYLKDFYQYDPDTRNWTQKSSYGGSKRRNAACFVIDGKGYIVTGQENASYPDDLYEYDPGTDIWTKKRQITNVSPETYDDAYGTTFIVGAGKVGFAINGKGYLATGGETPNTYVWEYDPTTDLWTEKQNFEKTARSYAVGFTIGNLGYLTTGQSGSSTYCEDLYSFDPTAIYNQYDK